VRGGIDLSDDVLYPSRDGGKLGLAFAWLTRNHMGPYYGSMPVGYYQQLQVHALDVITENARAKGLPLSQIRVHKGIVQSYKAGAWRNVVAAKTVSDEASRRSR
jgi:hypothetical protein